MLNNPNILDHPAEESGTVLIPASKGARLTNSILDQFGIMLCFGMASNFTGSLQSSTSDEPSAVMVLLIFGIIVCYYAGFEALFSKTPAKFLTGTHVVTNEGKKAGIGKCLLRTVCRAIPFEAFSLLASDVAWHDSIAGTMVVND